MEHEKESVRIFWSNRFNSGLVQQDCACADEGFLPEILWEPAGSMPDEDCACAGFSPASEPLQSMSPDARWHRVAELYQAPLNGEYTCYFTPLGAGGVVVLNRAARRILNAFASVATMAEASGSLPSLAPREIERAIEQLAALGLLQPAGLQPVLHDGGASTLSAWLHVTSACNLQCTYCYAPRCDQAMDGDTGLAALDAVFDAAVRYGYQTVKLKYAGGEPLLNFGLVRTLHCRAQERAQQNSLGLQEVVLSNGTLLTDEVLAVLGEMGARLMISLDGTGSDHDAQRPTADHRGSFVWVARNIDRALAQGIAPHLSVTLTGEQVAGAAAAVTFALQRGLTFNLNFVRAPEAQAGLWEVDEISMIETAHRAFQAIEASLPHYSLVAGLLDRASFASPHTLPCGAGHHYLVIGPSGEVARCQMDLARPVSDVWADDPLGVVRTDLHTFANVPVDAKDACRICIWRYACGGGCPRLAYQVAGRQRAASPYCHVYRVLYPELLRLEGLRLVEQGACP
jgi:uncharacterized protein